MERDETAGAMLTGIRCLVTGATGTLGSAISRALAGRGADLLLAGRSSTRLDAARAALGTVSGRIDTVAADLAADGGVGQVLDAAGTVDVLINNAAVQGPIGRSWDIDAAQWDDAVRMNLLVPVHLAHGVIPGMLRRGWGKIINISGGGATGPRANFAAYGVAKTGLVRFGETLAHELTGTGIDVNAIAPGAVGSAMTDAVLAAGAERSGAAEIAAAERAKAAGATAAGRAADLCAYLASHESDGITGRLIAALWDPWPALHERAAELAGSDIYTLRRIVPADRGKTWEETQA